MASWISRPQPETLPVTVEWKAVAGEENVLEGYASVFDVEDLHGDVVERGAFRKTIQERVPRGLVKLLDSHRYDIAHTLGTVIWAEEDAFGLRFRARLSSAPSAQDAKIKMLEGHASRNSIGYDPVRETWDKAPDGRLIRRLQEVKLFEISVVPLAANEYARLVSVKSVVPFQDLPLAPRDRPWDAAAAERRVRAWAGGGDDLGSINWTRYRRAFVWWDQSNPERLASYKLPIADVIDGRLWAVPRAVFAAAAAVQGARGGVDLPAEDRPRVQAHLGRYYAKMRREFSDEDLVAPWERDSLDLLVAEIRAGWSPSADDTDRIESAAKALFSVLDPLGRERLLKALAAGPGGGPPTAGERSGVRGVQAGGPAEPFTLTGLRRRARLLELDLRLAARRVDGG